MCAEDVGNPAQEKEAFMGAALVKVGMVKRWFSKMVISCVLRSPPATKAGMVV